MEDDKKRIAILEKRLKILRSGMVAKAETALAEIVFMIEEYGMDFAKDYYGPNLFRRLRLILEEI